MKGKKILMLISCLSLTLTSGCWDKVELNERAFINGLVIDINKTADENQGKNPGNALSDPFCEDKPKKIKVDFGVINPSKIQSGTNVLALKEVEAVDIPDAMEKLGQISSRKPFYGQMRILVFTEAALKNQEIFKQALDEFERKAVIDRNMKVVALEGNPEEYLHIKPQLENSVGSYVEGILENADVLSNTVDMTLNDVLVASVNGDGTFAMPVVRVEDVKNNIISISRLALIKNYKLLSILDTKYIKTYKILNGKFKNGRKLVNYKGLTVPLYIYSAEKKIWLENEGDNPTYRIKVTIEGDIEEFDRGKVIFDPKTIKEVKKASEDFLKAEIEETIKYFQNDVEIDYLGIRDYTNKFHHKFYVKHEENWDETFKNAKFDVEVEVNIRRIGTAKE